MKTPNRRQFLTTAVAGGAALANLSLSSCSSSSKKDELMHRYEKLDQVLNMPILKRELFPSPVIIRSLELLEYNNGYLCRVRSADGAEGLSVAHPTMATLFPVFLRNLRWFFTGQDARDLDLILERVFYYNFNFRHWNFTLLHKFQILFKTVSVFNVKHAKCQVVQTNLLHLYFYEFSLYQHR